jgi:hypothetical protein
MFLYYLILSMKHSRGTFYILSILLVFCGEVFVFFLSGLDMGAFESFPWRIYLTNKIVFHVVILAIDFI